MSPLITKILLPLCGSFALGTLVGWLANRLLVRVTRRKEREAWEAQLCQQREALGTAQHQLRNQAECIKNSQGQLTETTTALKNLEEVVATTKKEMKLKVDELAHLGKQLQEAEERAAQSNALVVEERQRAGQIDEELKTLWQELTDKTGTNMQLARQLKEQANLNEKLREQESSQLLHRSRLEFTLRTKENELQQLQQRMAVIEAQQTEVLEKNRNLSHSCARYQTDLHAAAETIERLRAELAASGRGEAAIDFPTLQFPLPDITEHMKVQHKDEEIARLRARVAGLQLLLRHGVKRPRTVTAGTPTVVDVAQK